MGSKPCYGYHWPSISYSYTSRYLTIASVMDGKKDILGFIKERKFLLTIT